MCEPMPDRSLAQYNGTRVDDQARLAGGGRAGEESGGSDATAGCMLCSHNQRKDAQGRD